MLPGAQHQATALAAAAQQYRWQHASRSMRVPAQPAVAATTPMYSTWQAHEVSGTSTTSPRQQAWAKVPCRGVAMAVHVHVMPCVVEATDNSPEATEGAAAAPGHHNVVPPARALANVCCAQKGLADRCSVRCMHRYSLSKQTVPATSLIYIYIYIYIYQQKV